MMQQPGPGAIPPPLAPLAQQQFQYQQPPPLVPPPQPQQPYMMMNMMPPQGQTPPAWAPQVPLHAQQVPLHAQQVPPQQMSQPTSADEVRTLWIGDLQYFMDENYLAACFGHTGEIHPVNTWVGAVVGAIPPLLGWVAASGQVSLSGMILPAALYFWQIPHFMALAYLCRNDYAAGGYRMLSFSMLLVRELLQ